MANGQTGADRFPQMRIPCPVSDLDCAALGTRTRLQQLVSCANPSLCRGRQLAITMTSGQHGMDGAELARFATSLNSAPRSPDLPSHAPACDQFRGLVTRVVRDH
jgi:hypothetical protein